MTWQASVPPASSPPSPPCPLAAALFTGVAAADNGAFADDGSNAAWPSIVGSGVGGDNNGNSSTTQQQAVGSGASNQNNTAQVNGSGFTAIDQTQRRRQLHRPLVSRSRGPGVRGRRMRSPRS